MATSIVTALFQASAVTRLISICFEIDVEISGMIQIKKEKKTITN